MDFLRLANPWVLAALAPAWAALFYFVWRARPRPSGAAARGIMAAMAALLLIAAIAGPQVRVSRQDQCPVLILEDVSPSMMPRRAPPPAALPRDPAADALAPYVAALPAGHAGLIRFDDRATVVAVPFTPGAARLALPDTFPPPAEAGHPETDIQAALEQAAATMPSDRGVALLYTDARETRGSAVRAAEALAARGIQVHAVVPKLAPRDVRIVAVSSPAEVPAGATVPVEVRLAATLTAPATVRVERSAPGGAPAARWERKITIDAEAGATLLFEDAPPAAGIYRYWAEVTSPADDWPENDRGSCLVQVGGTREVAWFHDGRPPALLEQVRARLPADVRLRAAPIQDLTVPLDATAAVVLDNVSAWAIGRDAAAEIARQVTDGGLGLLVLGGDAAFAAGGYGDSPLEAVLPVTSRTGERPPLEMAIVLDSSGSMNELLGARTKLALAKVAVTELRAALADADRAAVIAFAGEPMIVSPLVPISQWEALRQRLLAVEAGGGTRLTPAVTAALDLFAPPPSAKIRRHILLLTDGRSQDFDIAALTDRCRRDRVTISAVATGADADLDRLGRLARDTGGRLYAGGDLEHLAETFLKDLAWARGEGLIRQARPARWVRPEPIWPGLGPPLPAVDAFNVTGAKAGADVLWAAPATNGVAAAPLLAAWQRGLGKVAAMPWPAGAAPPAWGEKDALGGYIADVLAWLAAQPQPADWSARLVERNGAWRVRVEVRTGALERFAGGFSASVFAWAAETRRVELTQVAPGIYEGLASPRAPATALHGGSSTGLRHGTALVAVRGKDAAAGLARLSVPSLPEREYERFGVDRARLEAIVRAGGGRIHTTPSTLAEIVRATEVRDFLPVGIYLVFAALAVAVLQAVLRLLGRL